MYSRKIIISVAGVIMFLLAGAGAMFFSSPGASTKQSQQRVSASPQDKPPEVITQPQEPQPSSVPSVWYVYVTGAVNSPGVYKLSEDSRVYHAIEAAGGFTRRADRASINLAEVLADEAHVHVAAMDETRQAALEVVRIPGYSTQARAASQTRGSSGLVDINHADEQELQRINGVGPAIAQRIIDYRNQHGAFARIDDLINVKGIGQAKLNQMRPQITLKIPLTGQGGRSSYTTSRTNTTAKTNTNLIDINHANSQELQRIKGVGPATAQRIIDYRNNHGVFTRPEDLLNVRGIGASKLSEIRTQIVIR